MRITCAGCATVYNLTPGEIERLPGAILPCRGCGKYIKVTTCPRCDAIYSITFSAPARNRYTLTCERCARPFVIDFPPIKDATSNQGQHEKIITRFFSTPFFKKRKKVAPQVAKRQEGAPPLHSPKIEGRGGFALQDFLTASARSLEPSKLIIAGSAFIAGSIIIFAYNRFIGLLYYSGAPGGQPIQDSVNTIIHLFPFVLLLLIYLASASAIAKIELGRDRPTGVTGPRGFLRHLGSTIGPVILASTAILAALYLILALFGAIPLVGPLLFAILFLPLYAASLATVVLLAIALWFFPPIVASTGPGPRTVLKAFLRFIRRHGAGLAYAVPLLTIITATASSVVLILHQTAVSLAIGFSSNALGAVEGSYFPATPSPLMSLADLAMIGSVKGSYRAVVDILLSSHPAAGFVIASALSLITVFLFTLLLSFTATISTHVYSLMEGSNDSNDRDRIRLLLLAMLLFGGVFLIRKIIF